MPFRRFYGFGMNNDGLFMFDDYPKNTVVTQSLDYESRKVISNEKIQPTKEVLAMEF